jgi:hypothetical protein
VTRWDEVDWPVLRWLADQPSSFIHCWGLRLTIRPDPAPSEDVPGLDERQVDEALMLWAGHGVIEGNRKESVAYASWTRLRVTGLGKQVLGEWPELDRLNSAESLRLLLATMAEQSTDRNEQADYRRVSGFLASIGDSIVDQTLKTAADAGVDELRHQR